MLIDPDSGELLDLTPRSWPLPRTAATDLDAPVMLSVTITKPVWESLRDGTADRTPVADLGMGDELDGSLEQRPVLGHQG